MSDEAQRNVDGENEGKTESTNEDVSAPQPGSVKSLPGAEVRDNEGGDSKQDEG